MTELIIAPGLPGARDWDAAHAAMPVRRMDSAPGGWQNTLRFARESVLFLGSQMPRSTTTVLHCNNLTAAYLGWWLHLTTGWRYAAWLHGEDVLRTRAPGLTRRVLAGAGLILTNSEFTKRAVMRLLPPRHVGAVAVVPLGVADAFLAPGPCAGAAAVRATLCPPEVPLLLGVARLSRRDRYKGVDMALRALAEWRSRGRRFRYVVAGAGDDREALQGLAQGLGLRDEVTFVGAVSPSRLLELYDACDLFLLPGREEIASGGGAEGFGIVFLEAAARGKPVVAGRAGGVPEAVQDGQTGILVDPHSPADIAAAVQRLCDDPALAQRLGREGRARVLREFTWGQVARRVRALHTASFTTRETGGSAGAET
ncbi:MAG: glycosyltransferase family 4 protein [Terriglobales bacterium]